MKVVSLFGEPLEKSGVKSMDAICYLHVKDEFTIVWKSYKKRNLFLEVSFVYEFILPVGKILREKAQVQVLHKTKVHRGGSRLICVLHEIRTQGFIMPVDATELIQHGLI